MKYLFWGIFSLMLNSVFSQNTNIKYEILNVPFFKDGGTIFFAIDKASGQIYFQRDYGTNAGKWIPFASPIPQSEKHEYTFKLYDKSAGHDKKNLEIVFIALDKFNGQVYYLIDSQNAVWIPFGYPIRTENSPTFTFDIRIETTQGITYFALNEITGQLYFMPDYGLDSGIWKPYGSTILVDKK